MKKAIKWISIFTLPAIFMAMLGIYVSQIPTVYNCYPGEDPAGSVFYTLEADTPAAQRAEGESYTAQVKLFGLLPIKNALINRITQKQLVVLAQQVLLSNTKEKTIN